MRAVGVAIVILASLVPAQQRLEILGATITYPDGRLLSALKYHDAYHDARARVERVTGSLPPPGVVIELVPDGDALNDALSQAGAERVPDWVAGVALPRSRRIVIRLDLRTPDPERVQGLLTHELCHVVVHAVVSGPDAQPVPRWLDEGLAQYAEGKPFSPERPRLALRAFFRRLIPLDELEREFPRSEGASGLAYAQSKSFVDWLAKTMPGEPFPRLLEELRLGATIEDAALLVFFDSLDNLERRWRADLVADRSWMPGALAQLGGALLLLVATVLGASRIVHRRQRGRELLERNEDPEPDGDPGACGEASDGGGPSGSDRRSVEDLDARRSAD